MLIGELSRLSGLSRDTIRFYEKESLIGARTPGKMGGRSNNYKNYPESTVSDLLFVQRTKVLGFTLVEIRRMLVIRGSAQPSRKWAAEAQAKLCDIDLKIKELQEVKRLLTEASARCSDHCLDAGCVFLNSVVAEKSGSDPWPAPPCANHGQSMKIPIS